SRRLALAGVCLVACAPWFASVRRLGWPRIRRDLYELSDSGATFKFEGRGSGHGVGLCQAGAARMGEQGRSYRQILDFYYPGASLGVAAQGFPWKSLGGERVEVITTKPGEDGLLVGLADRLAHAAEQRSGLRWNANARLTIYPTVPAFRDA